MALIGDIRNYSSV